MPLTTSPLCPQAPEAMGEFSSHPPPWTSPLPLRGGPEQKELHGGRSQKPGRAPACCYATPFVSCCLGNVSPSGAVGWTRPPRDGWTLAVPRRGTLRPWGRWKEGSRRTQRAWDPWALSPAVTRLLLWWDRCISTNRLLRTE